MYTYDIWPPLRAVRLVLTRRASSGGTSGFCPQVNMEESAAAWGDAGGGGGHGERAAGKGAAKGLPAGVQQ